MKSAGNAFILKGVSEDPDYGYIRKKPINVGFTEMSEGAAHQIRYLNALRGPEGQTVTFQRLGSCCQFKTKNGFMGSGLLDKYEVTYYGLEEPLILYLNLYDPGQLLAPKGFTLAAE
jgi:hypothetical protein